MVSFYNTICLFQWLDGDNSVYTEHGHAIRTHRQKKGLAR